MPLTPEQRTVKAEQQRKYRQRTNYAYDSKYNKAKQRALIRLSHQFPEAFETLFNEEREKVGLGPLQK